jgi:predicted GH43/DUF377 family glycosyl hydrolase
VSLRSGAEGGARNVLREVVRGSERIGPLRSRLYLLALLLVCAAGCNPSKRFVLPPATGPQSDVRWQWREHPSPVQARGSAGSWDSVDALNPSVVRWQNRLWNLYSGFDGKTWHTGVSWANDVNGIAAWTSKQKILSPDTGSWEGSYIAANGTAIQQGDYLLYWYQAGQPVPAIGLARSRDGFAWQKENRAVLDPGPNGSWDERGVADPYVIQQGEWLYMFYTGIDRAQRQRLGVARSRDGIGWEKSLDNPILDIGGHDEWDEGGLGEPAVWQSHGWYWMLYTGRAWDEKRRIGMARSADGIHWQKLDKQHVFAGASAWDAAVICDPSVELLSDQSVVRVWFGGGDKPKPDEGLNGQIGYAELVPRK